MSENISNKMIVQYLSGECTEEDKSKIENAMESDLSLKKIIDNFEKVWFAKREELSVQDIDSKWLEMKKMAEADLRKSRNQTGYGIPDWMLTIKDWLPAPAVSLRYAAFTVILIVAVFLMRDKIWNIQNTPVQYYTVKVPSEKRTTITLSDGTKVTLDAGSMLKYPAAFGDIRDVYLEGEAYFEVSKDPDHPFRVQAGSAFVKVVGTKFNVRAWEENSKVTVTVIEGIVLVSNDKLDTSKSVFLTRGKQSSVSYLGDITNPVNVDPEKFIKWMHNEIYFHDANLKEILAQLKRWYGYSFSIDDTIINNQIMSVHLRHVNVNEVINVISRITGSKIIRNGKNISFVKK